MTGCVQTPYTYRFTLGSAECTIVTDGALPLGDPNAAFLNIDKAEISRELRDNFLSLDNAVLEQNVLIVNFGDRVVLFDTGMGNDKLFGESTGRLALSLRQAGIDPADVDAVVLSHAHVDHCGGLIGLDGQRNFPKALYFIGEADFDYWTDDTKIPSEYPGRLHFLKQARSNLLPVKDAMRFYRDNEKILPGVTALSAPGHTVSHTIFMIESDGRQLCYIGDLAHHPVLLLEHPRTQFAYDTDAALSAESRVRMLTMLAANRIPLLAYHFAWPGVGHIAAHNGGFHYYPLAVRADGITAI
jgi:glyoxylase-like metal-dependent hydrolase (beta-lactamase superfamily II)